MTSAIGKPDGDSGDIAEQLASLERGREHALERISHAARSADVGALLLVGSLGRGGGDAWSDLDLIAVPGDGYTGLGLVDLFGTQVLASVMAPRNAPVGGDYLGVCLEVAGLPLWVDWYLWPRATARTPTDSTAIYDNLGLESSDLSFIPLIQAHSDPTAGAHTDAAIAVLLRVAVAAKYLARRDLTLLVSKVPSAEGLSITDIADLLRRILEDHEVPRLTMATAATRRLLDLAEATGNSSDQTSWLLIRALEDI